MMRLAFLVAVVVGVGLVGLAGGPGAVLAMQTPQEAPAQPGQAALVLVEKGARRMTLFDAHGNVMRTYRVSLGNNPVGNKEQSGDGRTPEGTYTIDTRNPDSSFYLSLRISYPNESDVKRAKASGVSPGGDIFIHGKPNDKSWMWWKYNTSRDWTEGCIAVTNEDIREIWHLVPDGTTIIINP